MVRLCSDRKHLQEMIMLGLPGSIVPAIVSPLAKVSDFVYLNMLGKCPNFLLKKSSSLEW